MIVAQDSQLGMCCYVLQIDHQLNKQNNHFSLETLDTKKLHLKWNRIRYQTLSKFETFRCFTFKDMMDPDRYVLSTLGSLINLWYLLLKHNWVYPQVWHKMINVSPWAISMYGIDLNKVHTRNLMHACNILITFCLLSKVFKICSPPLPYFYEIVFCT